MKISLNLANPLGWHERYGLAAGTLALVLSLGVLVILARSAVSNFRKDRAVEQPVLQVQKRLSRVQKKVSALHQYLAQPQLHRLAEETSYLNGLIRRKQFSIEELIARVSRLLPPNVRVDGLTYSPASQKPVIHISIEAKNERAFEGFLSNLEGASGFSDVVVADQSFGGSTANSSTILATCTAIYRESGTTGQGTTDAETSTQDPPTVH